MIPCPVRRAENSSSCGRASNHGNRTWRQYDDNDEQRWRHSLVTGDVVWRNAPSRTATGEPAAVDLLYEIYRQTARCIHNLLNMYSQSLALFWPQNGG